MKFRFCSVLLPFLVFLLFAAGSSPCFGANSEDASSAISNAEAKVATCYGAVADAANAGANVSELLNVLNEAGWLLSKAKLAYNMTDFDSAFAYANDCQSTLNEFVEQAESVKSDAERAGYLNFMVNFVGSAVGAVCVVVGGFAYWTYSGKREWTKEKA